MGVIMGFSTVGSQEKQDLHIFEQSTSIDTVGWI